MKRFTLLPFFFLRLVLVVASLPPMIIGLAGIISGEYAARVGAILSRAAIAVTPEINYFVKPLGLYVFMFGCLMAWAIIDPVKYRAVIAWGAILFFLRGIQRLSLTPELHRLFGVPVALNILHGSYLISLALTLWLLRPKKEIDS
jgi:hypothetical protein